MSEGPDWATILSTGAGVASAIAAWSSAKAAKASQRASQGEVIGRLLGEYSSPEMDKTIQLIDRHRPIIEAQTIADTPLGHIVGEFARELPELKEAGRKLHLFMRHASILLSNKAISPALFRDGIVQTAGYQLWAETWIPYMRTLPEASEDKGDLAWADKLIAKNDSAPSIRLRSVRP